MIGTSNMKELTSRCAQYFKLWWNLIQTAARIAKWDLTKSCSLFLLVTSQVLPPINQQDLITYLMHEIWFSFFSFPALLIFSPNDVFFIRRNKFPLVDLTYRHVNGKSASKWSLTCFKSILKFSHCNYL